VRTLTLEDKSDESEDEKMVKSAAHYNRMKCCHAVQAMHERSVGWKKIF